MAHEVFVAHATPDTATAEAVCAGLESAGIACWMAPRDVKPGRPYSGEITRAIKSSKVLLLLVSHAANDSEHVLREVELAANSRLHILQLRIEESEPSDDFRYFLSLPQWVDAIEPPLEQHLDRLVRSVRGLLGSSATPPPPARPDAEKPSVMLPPERSRPSRQPVKRSRKGIWAVFAAAGLVAALALGGYRLFSPTQLVPPVTAATPSPTPAAPHPSPSSPVPAAPRTLLVPDAYSTIQAAIDAARAGDTVMVKPGVYREAIIFKDGIRLLGTDASTCRLEPVDGAAAVISAFNCKSGSIERLTFDGSKNDWNVIFDAGWEMEQDRPTYIKEVKSGSPAEAAGLAAGMRVLRVDGENFISATMMRYQLARGAVARDVEVEVDAAAGQMQKKTLRTAKLSESGHFHPGAGIALINSSLEVRTCSIESTGGAGIAVHGPFSRPKLLKNECRLTGASGIAFNDGAAGEADDNVCEKSGHCGIDISGSATAPTLRRNKCRLNSDHGIHFQGGSSGLAVENECEQNKDDGIAVSDSRSAPTLSRNRCVSNEGSGITFSGGASGVAEENTCLSNKQSGIYFSSGAAGRAKGNTVEMNEWDGITVNGADTAPTLTDNKLIRNKGNGISIDKNAKKAVVGNNTHTENKGKPTEREATFK